jgi:hypothetical protein
MSSEFLYVGEVKDDSSLISCDVTDKKGHCHDATVIAGRSTSSRK